MDVTVEQAEGRPAIPAAHAVLAMRAIDKRWPRASEPVLAHVDLEVQAGEIVAITGRNGAGKTTLLRIAAGLLAADAGTVRIGGLDPERERTACQRRIGFLSAGNSGLYGRLRVSQHLEFWSRIALLPGQQRRDSIVTIYERFALDELEDRRVDRLSMGQRQRVRLALALLHGPDLLLLDEPRTSLDDEGTQLLAQAVDAVVSAGGAAVLCAPKSEDGGIPFDRCMAMDSGRLVPA